MQRNAHLCDFSVFCFGFVAVVLCIVVPGFPIGTKSILALSIGCPSPC